MTWNLRMYQKSSLDKVRQKQNTYLSGKCIAQYVLIVSAIVFRPRVGYENAKDSESSEMNVPECDQLGNGMLFGGHYWGY